MLKQKKQSETPCIQEVSDWFRKFQTGCGNFIIYRKSLNILVKDILLFM